MNRQEKTEEVERIRSLLDGAQLVVLAEYAGLAVNEMVELRQELRKVSGQMRIVKNTLAKIATKDTPFESLAAHFKGPVAMSYTMEDAPGTAKALVSFQKQHKALDLTAGLLAGGQVLDAKGVVSLSTLPGKDELRGMFLSTLSGVARKFVTLAATPARNMAGVLEARRSQLAGE